jgi:alkaline phosphatase
VLLKFAERKEDIATILSRDYGLTNPTEEELKTVQNAIVALLAGGDVDEGRRVIGRLLSKRAHIGWTTGGHTPDDVPFFCWHANANAVCPSGTFENTEIAKIIERNLGLNLQAATRILFPEGRVVESL